MNVSNTIADIAAFDAQLMTEAGITVERSGITPGAFYVGNRIVFVEATRSLCDCNDALTFGHCGHIEMVNDLLADDARIETMAAEFQAGLEDMADAIARYYAGI